MIKFCYNYNLNYKMLLFVYYYLIDLVQDSLLSRNYNEKFC